MKSTTRFPVPRLPLRPRAPPSVRARAPSPWPARLSPRRGLPRLFPARDFDAAEPHQAVICLGQPLRQEPGRGAASSRCTEEICKWHRTGRRPRPPQFRPPCCQERTSLRPPLQGRCGAGGAKSFPDPRPHLWFVLVAKDPLPRKQGALEGAALPGRGLEKEPGHGAGVAVGPGHAGTCSSRQSSHMGHWSLFLFF